MVDAGCYVYYSIAFVSTGSIPIIPCFQTQLLSFTTRTGLKMLGAGYLKVEPHGARTAASTLYLARRSLTTVPELPSLLPYQHSLLRRARELQLVSAPPYKPRLSLAFLAPFTHCYDIQIQGSVHTFVTAGVPEAPPPWSTYCCEARRVFRQCTARLHGTFSVNTPPAVYPP